MRVYNVRAVVGTDGVHFGVGGAMEERLRGVAAEQGSGGAPCTGGPLLATLLLCLICA